MFQWVTGVSGVFRIFLEIVVQWVYRGKGARGRRGTSCSKSRVPAWGSPSPSARFAQDHGPPHTANHAPSLQRSTSPPIQLTQRPIVPLEHVNTQWSDCRPMTGSDDNLGAGSINHLSKGSMHQETRNNGAKCQSVAEQWVNPFGSGVDDDKMTHARDLCEITLPIFPYSSECLCMSTVNLSDPALHCPIGTITPLHPSYHLDPLDR